MPDLAYVNGEIMPIEKAVVPIEDRGYQFGDGVYEFVASYEGRLFMLEEHLDRLERSMRELAFDPISRSEIKAAICDLLKRSGYPRAGIYIQISRGVAPRNHAITPDMAAQIIMTIRPVKEIQEDIRKNGATAITVQDTRWVRCDIKTVQLLANSLAKQKALDSGCDDAIFVSDQGIVREGTSSNLFIISGGKLITHPLTDYILPGITRTAVLNICKAADLEVEESFFGTETLYGADEVFLTGTVTEVLPVVRIDGRSIGDGKVGPITRRIYDLLRKQALAGGSA
ncbi:MAG: D-amino-acid transaminase [Desulfosarcina sp.]|nr:D-amino-acid transaminase [Desulfosarcina sp.]